MDRNQELDLPDGNMEMVCGRGKRYEDLPGNQLFRKMIQIHACNYASVQTSRSEKSLIIRTVREQLKSQHGLRFIKQDGNRGWVNLEEKEIKLKIGHALRDVESLRRKQEKNLQKKMAKRKWIQTRMRNSKRDVVPDEFLATNSARAAVCDSRLFVESHNASDTSNILALEDSVNSINTSHELRLLEKQMLQTQLTIIERASKEEDDISAYNAHTFQQMPPLNVHPPHHSSSVVQQHTGAAESSSLADTKEPHCPSPFALLDMSLLLLACEVPIVSSSSDSSSSVTSDDWLLVCDDASNSNMVVAI